MCITNDSVKGTLLGYNAYTVLFYLVSSDMYTNIELCNRI